MVTKTPFLELELCSQDVKKFFLGSTYHERLVTSIHASINVVSFDALLTTFVLGISDT